MFGQQKIQVVVESPSRRASQLPTPAASSQLDATRVEGMGPVHLRKLYTAQADALMVDSSDDEPTPARKPRSKPSTKDAEPILSATTTTRHGRAPMDSESEEDIVPVRSGRRPKAALIQLSSGDDNSTSRAVQDPVTPKKTSNTRHGRVMLVNGSSDETETEAPASKLRQKLSISPKILKDPFVVSDKGEDISSEDDVVTSVRRRRNTAPLRTPTEEFEQAEGDSPEDLQDEVEDLQGTSDIEIKETRTRGRQDKSGRSIRQQKLEELRRRRAGIRKESEEEGEHDPTTEDEASEPEPVQQVMRRGDDLDEYEEDFVDDENETLGIDLGRAGVPLEFTYHANKKTIDHFTTEIEWMVHNKINPAFDRYDEIYLLAHDKLDKEFKGYAGSKFMSSVWRPNFGSALKTRPEFYRVDIPTMLEHKCDACNRSNHPPKHRATFTGKPYDRNTLEAIENDEDDDSSDAGSEEKGSSSTDDEQNFFLGRYD